MKAWIEPDPNYQEGRSYLSIEVYDQNKNFIKGRYSVYRRLKWQIDNLEQLLDEFGYTE